MKKTGNMAIAFAKLIGGFVRWLLHGCKTSLKDEVEVNLEFTWGGTYDTENYIIGVGTVITILGLVIRLVRC